MRMKRLALLNSRMPPEGWIKINTDAACRHDRYYVGVGCIVRDDSGDFLRARAGIVKVEHMQMSLKF